MPLKGMVKDIYETAGIPRTQNGDCNAGHTIGYSEFANSTVDGERQWSASCYSFGPNVTLWSRTQVQKLLFEGSKAVGVSLLPNANGGTHVRARKEVLVCGGAQGSPKLLLLRYCMNLLMKSILTITDILIFSKWHWSQL